MTKVVIKEGLSRSPLSPSKDVRITRVVINGQPTATSTLSANSQSFSSDLYFQFKKNVTEARLDSERISLGTSTVAPKQK